MKRKLLFTLGLMLISASVGWGACPRCGTLTSRWCSECSPGEVCDGCADRVWPRGQDNKEFFRAPFDQEYRWEYGTRISDLEETLNTKLTVLESRNFRVIADISHARTHDVSNLCERYYNNIRRTFNVGSTTRLFAGRCQIFCFKEYKTFREFTDSVEKAKLIGCSGGFTVVRGFEPKIVVFTQGVRSDQFIRTLIHEMVHVIMGLYAKEIRLKDWLQEGTAQYFEFQFKSRTSRAKDWKKRVCSYLKQGKLTPAAELMEMDISAIDHQGYVEAWSLVSYMVKKGGVRFGKFINLVKDGTSQKEALKKAFDCTPEELSERWKAYIKKL